MLKKSFDAFKQLNKQRVFFVGLGVCLLTFGLYSILAEWGILNRNNYTPPNIPNYNYLEGFRHSISKDGKLTLQISADNFGVHKKKIGKLRFGLINEAIFRNAHIKLFNIDKTDPPAPPLVDKYSESKITKPNLAHSSHPSYAFGQPFYSYLKSAVQNRRIAAVRFEPIYIELYSGDKQKVSVSADKGSLDAKTGAIEFTGNVQWIAATHKIQTKHLTANLSENYLYCPDKFTLKEHNELREGRGLKADLFLRHISDRESIQSSKPS